MASADEKREALASLLEDIARQLRHGCGNHGCRIKRPVGQGTNSGCRCGRLADTLLRCAEVAEETGS